MSPKANAPVVQPPTPAATLVEAVQTRLQMTVGDMLITADPESEIWRALQEKALDKRIIDCIADRIVADLLTGHKDLLTYYFPPK